MVSTAQLVSVSFSDQRARIWSPYREDGEPWREAVNCWSPWSNLSSGVTDGCVMWWCLNSVVSDIIIDIVSFGINGCPITSGGSMGGTLGGSAGGAGLCWEWVRWATGCVGIEGRGTSTLGACGISMLVGFSPL